VEEGNQPHASEVDEGVLRVAGRVEAERQSSDADDERNEEKMELSTDMGRLQQNASNVGITDTLQW
jgi:hypothetical protein